ncbi:MAG: hypothetical protein A2Y07_03010 [Planctomycetes bacterium GWF2_50_10]|nr:MAG: hypothetical protein A2Y07_03010 [Planctomycetes bacterium GWF2_50_10]
MKRFCAAVLLITSSIISAEPNETGVGLTIYNGNFAVVKERRTLPFSDGLNTLQFTDVAAAIDPTTVKFECLSSPGSISILEQNYQYDLANTQSLLKRYLNKDIALSVKGAGSDPSRNTDGKLIGARDENIILMNSQTKTLEIIGRNDIESIKLTELPADLIVEPALVWLAHSQISGDQLCQITYTTNEINWNADYTATLDPNETSVSFSGWVTIDNKSGTAYKDAKLKLVAGDVRRIQPQPRMEMLYMAKDRIVNAAAEGFEEKPFMEYHLYTLARPSTIKNNETKQIELIPTAEKVAVKKLLVFDRQEKADKVQVKFEFANSKENQLGIALPQGKVRVFKKDPADGMLEFVGEDQIKHTARNEKVSLYIGDAFDIVPEYTMLDSKVDRRSRTETHKIELRNRKDSPVTVRVDEKFPQWVNWTIDDSTHKYTKHDATTARFEINISADTNETLQYTATQSW